MYFRTHYITNITKVAYHTITNSRCRSSTNIWG